MEENKFAKRKNWIKNAIIVFLVIMLILTFFSNTIMNHSLPQVVTQYVTSGTITTKLRGTGTVESGDPYNVMVKVTRKVSGIAVKEGAKVAEGDVLVYLAEEDSDELQAAEEALEAAQNAYDAALLSADITQDSITGSQKYDVAAFRAQITLLQDQIRALQGVADVQEREVGDIQTEINSIQAQINILSTQDSSATSLELAEARIALDNAAAALETAQSAAEEAQGVRDAAKETMDAAEGARNTARETMDAAENAKSEAQEAVSAQQAVIDGLDTGDPEYEARLAAENETLAALTAARDEVQTAYDAAVTEYNNAESALGEAANAYNIAVSEYNSAVIPYNEAKEDYDGKKLAYETLENALTNASSLRELNERLVVANNSLTAKTKEYNDTTEAVSDKKTELSELVSSISGSLSLRELLEKIEDARERVEKEREKSAGEEITAPIAGTVISVNVASGKETDPSVPVVVLQPEGQGYTLSFSITNDQAKLISVGDEAELVNSWWYNDVHARVAQIKPDPSSPNQKRLVVCSLEGDSLTAGQSLTLSIGSRSASYDTIVPTSAIHEDNNGKFVLIVEVRSSPLGNRYRAVRYDCQVLASDDTQSAISSALSGYEYVITTSTKPISAGDLVRLEE